MFALRLWDARREHSVIEVAADAIPAIQGLHVRLPQQRKPRDVADGDVESCVQLGPGLELIASHRFVHRPHVVGQPGQRRIVGPHRGEPTRHHL